MKIHKSDFGELVFLDEHTVIARANDNVNIDGQKIVETINEIERELDGDYALILERKATYSVMPVEIYNYFSTIQRLKAIAIVSYKLPEFLPPGMEKRIYKGELEMFCSIEDAHNWLKIYFENKKEEPELQPS